MTQSFVKFTFFTIPLIILILFGGFGFKTWRDFHHLRSNESVQSLIINKGASIHHIANVLQKSRVVTSARQFYYVVRLKMLMGIVNGKKIQIQAGEYAFDKGSTAEDILLKMIQGQTVQHRITVVEGWTSAEILSALNQALHLKGPCPKSISEGSLLPQTYY